MNFLHAAVEDGKLRTAARRRADRRADPPRAGGRPTRPRELIIGIRPEHFEDAALIDDETRRRGIEFEAPVDIVESMGSDKYVYFTVEGERATAAELEELAADAGAADFAGAGSNLVTRLSAESPVREGESRRVWFNLEKIHLFDPGSRPQPDPARGPFGRRAGRLTPDAREGPVACAPPALRPCPASSPSLRSRPSA